LGSELLGLLPEFRLSGFVQLRRRSGATGHGNPNLKEEVFLSSGSTNAKHACRLTGRVAELVRRVCGDVHGLSGTNCGFTPAKSQFELALDEAEGFFEVVAMRRRPASRRNEHIDEAEAARGVFARDQNCVGVADNADVATTFSSRDGQFTLRVVRRLCGLRSRLRIRFGCHVWLLSFRSRLDASQGGLELTAGILFIFC
jgi:hypothetical protein